jgi:hypothetical protein
MVLGGIVDDGILGALHLWYYLLIKIRIRRKELPCEVEQRLRRETTAGLHSPDSRVFGALKDFKISQQQSIQLNSAAKSCGNRQG